MDYCIINRVNNTLKECININDNKDDVIGKENISHNCIKVN